ncbi:hypothetical protein CEXT_516491 [Caerostris extrusa]|uniref:Uncharacterized protein n=1 Tax=Caerostris extrusa TaxID=172846 RepID=A0AAV4SFG2_CAEEX|nr:hypothetical protein CEXT_516491 [Caerostris extrusa]
MRSSPNLPGISAKRQSSSGLSEDVYPFPDRILPLCPARSGSLVELFLILIVLRLREGEPIIRNSFRYWLTTIQHLATCNARLSLNCFWSAYCSIT